MQALKDMPQIFQKIDDLRRFSSSESLLVEYKKNFKQFIEALTNEVLKLIDKY